MISRLKGWVAAVIGVVAAGWVGRYPAEASVAPVEMTGSVDWADAAVRDKSIPFRVNAEHRQSHPEPTLQDVKSRSEMDGTLTFAQVVRADQEARAAVPTEFSPAEPSAEALDPVPGLEGTATKGRGHAIAGRFETHDTVPGGRSGAPPMAIPLPSAAAMFPAGAAVAFWAHRRFMRRYRK